MGGTVQGDRKALAFGETFQEQAGSFVNDTKSKRGYHFPRTAGTLKCGIVAELWIT